MDKTEEPTSPKSPTSPESSAASSPVSPASAASTSSSSSMGHNRDGSLSDDEAHRPQARLTAKSIRESSGCYTSTLAIYKNTTVQRLQLIPLLQGMAVMALQEMKVDMERENAIYPSLFDEEQHPVVEGADIESPPTVDEIVDFVGNFFEMLELPTESALIMAVYLIRIVNNEPIGRVAVLPRTWRRIMLAGAILTAKIWDDMAVFNSDFTLFPRDGWLAEQYASDLNELERAALSYLQYNVNVRRRAYTECYFNLRSAAIQAGYDFDVSDASVEDAARDYERFTRRRARKISRQHDESERPLGDITPRLRRSLSDSATIAAQGAGSAPVLHDVVKNGLPQRRSNATLKLSKSNASTVTSSTWPTSPRSPVS